MPRPEAPIEATGPLAEFAEDLRALRTSAAVDYRTMEKREHFSYTTFSKAASGQQLPTLAVTKAFVRACGGDVAEWTARWHLVNDGLSQAPTERLPVELLQSRRPPGAHRAGREDSKGETDGDDDTAAVQPLVLEPQRKRKLPFSEALSVLALTTALSVAAGSWLVDRPPSHHLEVAAALTPGGSERAESRSFTIVDILDPVLTVSPGGRGRRVVRVMNPNDAALVVTELTVTVGMGKDDAGTVLDHCVPPLVKVVDSPALPITVPRKDLAYAEFVLEMSPSSPKECEKASFYLNYTGRGVLGSVVDGVPRQAR